MREMENFRRYAAAVGADRYRVTCIAMETNGNKKTFILDKEGGITVNDCEAVAREMNEILDREDFVEDSYVFEVSSPGLGRPLKKEKDYIRSMGKEVEIRTYRAINREKEFYGILSAYDENTVTIKTEDGTEMTFEKSDIALIRLAFDF